jgi:hypothetical protein
VAAREVVLVELIHGVNQRFLAEWYVYDVCPTVADSNGKRFRPQS